MRQVMLPSFVRVANMDSKTYQVPGYGGPGGSVKWAREGHVRVGWGQGVGGKTDGEKSLYKDPKRGSDGWR